MKSCIYFLIIAVHLLFAVARNDPFQGQYLISNREAAGVSKENHHLINATFAAAAGDDDDDTHLDRIWGGGCSKEDIYISQGQTTPLPSGIPTYMVHVGNICMPGTGTGTRTGGCIISDVHLSCGWFSSARLINPVVFKRISYDDCSVNNGNPISPGQTIFFQYANTYPYPLSVSSVSCS